MLSEFQKYDMAFLTFKDNLAWRQAKVHME